MRSNIIQPLLQRVLIFLFLRRPLPFSPFPFPSLPSHSLSVCLKMSAHTHGSSSSTQNIVGVHYRVGKKIGEGSFGVIFEGPFPLSPTSTPRVPPDLTRYPRREPAQLTKRGHQVCERRSFVAAAQPIVFALTIRQLYRSPERQKRLNFATSVGRIAYWLVVVRLAFVAFAAVI